VQIYLICDIVGPLRTICRFKLRFKLRSIGTLFETIFQMPSEAPNTLRNPTYDVNYHGLADCSPTEVLGELKKESRPRTSPHLSPSTPNVPSLLVVSALELDVSNGHWDGTYCPVGEWNPANLATSGSGMSSVMFVCFEYSFH
jgi:hypothetical protein